MSIESKILCGAQVYYDDYENRWVRAIGPDVRSWEMRFGSDFTTACEYTVTPVNTGGGTSTIAQGITAGDRALITTDDADNDAINLQVVGTPFQLAAGHPLYFGAKISINEATQSDLLVGMATKDITLIAAHALNVVDDGIYFYKLDNTVIIYGAYEKSGTVGATASGVAMDTSKHIYEIFYDGVGSITYSVDGAQTVKAESGYPTVVLSPSLFFATGSAAVKTASVEWMRCIQL
jgi:hypothetical protein